MIKHIGRNNDRKVVIIYRQIPGEDHMCLLVYSDLLPRLLHDEVMACLESAVGQQTNDLADALFRCTMADGRNALEVLHHERYMKKVQTSQVIVTPTSKSSCRLDELNSILTEMAKGEEAVKRLADLDKQTGFTGQNKRRPRELGEPDPIRNPAAPRAAAKVDPMVALSDEDIAKQLTEQATRMRAESAQMLAEIARLEAEAAALIPKKAKTVKAKAAKPTSTVKSNGPAKSKATKVKAD
jgi:hypothetical protein